MKNKFIFIIILAFLASCTISNDYQANITTNYINSIPGENGNQILRFSVKNNTDKYLKMTFDIQAMNNDIVILYECNKSTDLMPNQEMIKGIQTNLPNDTIIDTAQIKIIDVFK